MQRGFAPAHHQGGKRLAPSRGGLETPAELPHRLDPSLADDAQPFQDRGNLVRDRPALAGPKLPARPFQKWQIFNAAEFRYPGTSLQLVYSIAGLVQAPPP